MNKTEFKKWYDILSDDGKRNLVFNPYGSHPMSMNVCALEIANNTKLGKSILKQLSKPKPKSKRTGYGIKPGKFTISNIIGRGK